MTDQPRAKFYLQKDDDHALTTSVYGLRYPYQGPDPDATKLGWRVDTLTPALLALHAWLREFAPATSEPWAPRTIELNFWSFAHAKKPLAPWPSAWPDLNDPRVVTRGTVTSLYLEGSRRDELNEFLGRANFATEIMGRKMSVALRPVFPGETLWRRAFQAASAQEFAKK